MGVLLVSDSRTHSWSLYQTKSGSALVASPYKESQTHPPTINYVKTRLIKFHGGKIPQKKLRFSQIAEDENNSSVILLPVSCNPRACEGAANTRSAIMAWFQQCHSSWVVNVNLILLLYSCDFKTVLKTQNMSPTKHTSSWMCTFMWSVGREKPFFFSFVCAVSVCTVISELHGGAAVSLWFFWVFLRLQGWRRVGPNQADHLSPSTPSLLPPPVSSFNHSLHPLLHLSVPPLPPSLRSAD